MTRKSLRVAARLFLTAASLCAAAYAQLPSNASLKGAYNMRYLGEDTRNSSAMSFQGTITFDGAGKYTLTGTGVNSKTSGNTLRSNTSGAYNVLSNGMVTIDNPLDTSTSANVSGPIFAGLGNGIVIGSSTEGSYLDLFVAVPAATAASAAILSGTYNVAHLEFLNGNFTTGTRATYFPMTADGNGGLGNVTIKGTAQSLSDAATVQTSTGATYTVTANGTGTLVLPAPSGVAANNVLLSGTKVLYAAADGSFFIAGGATAYDMVIGLKAAPGATFNGLFFSSYLQNYAVGSNGDGVYAVSGSTNAIGSISQSISHERTNSEFSYPYDYTYSDSYKFSADGTSPDYNEALGAGGNLAVFSGASGNYLIGLYAKSAPITPTSGLFLNPQGIVNAANSVPFTAQFAPGEVVTLYGSGFSSQTATASAPFPTTLGGAQVNISYTDASNKTVSVNAPIYYIQPDQLSAVIPYTVPGDGTAITFSVTSNGAKSNEVTVYSGPSFPGVFTTPSGGLGTGAVLHQDYSLVTSSSPAKAGETIQIFLTGLGALNTSVSAGAPGPTNPLAKTTLPVDIELIDSTTGKYYLCTVVYSGLAPDLGGLYQVNATLPTDLPTGTMIISVYVGDGSDYGDGWNEQATLPVAK